MNPGWPKLVGMTDDKKTEQTTVWTPEGYKNIETLLKEVKSLTSRDPGGYVLGWTYYPSQSYCFAVDNQQDNFSGESLVETRLKKMFQLYTHPVTKAKVLIISGASILYSTLFQLLRCHGHTLQSLEAKHKRKTRTSEKAYQKESAPIWKCRAIIRYVISELGKTWVTTNKNRGYSFNIADNLTCLACGHQRKTYAGAYAFSCSNCTARNRPHGYVLIHDKELINDMLQAIEGVSSNIDSKQFVKISWEIMHGNQLY